MTLKKAISRANTIICIGFLVNIIETIVFLFMYGWHWLPASLAEKNWDTIASTIMFIGFIMLFYSLVKAAESVSDLEEEVSKLRKSHLDSLTRELEKLKSEKSFAQKISTILDEYHKKNEK